MEDVRNCTVVVNGIFCGCGGVMKQEGNLLMSQPPQAKMVCPFCGESEVVLYSRSGTDVNYKAIPETET